MNIKQLITALEKIHPDFYDQDLVILDADDEGKMKPKLLAYAGIIMVEDLSYAALGTVESAYSIAKSGIAKDIKTGRPITEEDCKPPTEDET